MKRCNQCWRYQPESEFESGRPGWLRQNCRGCRGRRARGERAGRPAALDERKELRLTWRRRSNVEKLGGLPSSSTAGFTCPTSCELRGNGCYAEFGMGGARWRDMSQGKHGIAWDTFLDEVRRLPKGQMWRHNLAGDLPGEGDAVDVGLLQQLVSANRGRRGFTYTHKPMRRPRVRDAIQRANQTGFTVNLSARDAAHADELLELGVGPVVAVVPSDYNGGKTPLGVSVVVCPAQTNENVSCASCGLCARAERGVVVGFRAHGQMRRGISLRVLGASA